jgi:hypothetical protein
MKLGETFRGEHVIEIGLTIGHRCLLGVAAVNGGNVHCQPTHPRPKRQRGNLDGALDDIPTHGP